MLTLSYSLVFLILSILISICIDWNTHSKSMQTHDLKNSQNHLVLKASIMLCKPTSVFSALQKYKKQPIS